MSKKKKRPLFVSPRGIFVYPWLNRPDTKFDPEGKYRVQLKYDANDEAGVAFVKKLAERHKKQVRDARAELGDTIKESAKPFKKDDDGNWLVQFKLNAVGKTREGETFTNKPVLFDASGQPCPDARVAGGSEGKVSFEIIDFGNAGIGAGISLRMKAVQIIKLVEWDSGTAEKYGFEEEEGFSASDSSEFESTSDDFESEDETEEDAGDDDFDF
jgi:hypothetical protein